MAPHPLSVGIYVAKPAARVALMVNDLLEKLVLAIIDVVADSDWFVEIRVGRNSLEVLLPVEPQPEERPAEDYW